MVFFLWLLFDPCERPSLPAARRAFEQGRRFCPLAMQSWVDAAISVTMVRTSLDQLISPPKQILIVFFLRDRPSWGGTNSLYASYMPSAAARRPRIVAPTVAIRTALLLIDALNEHVVAWHVCRETVVRITTTSRCVTHSHYFQP